MRTPDMLTVLEEKLNACCRTHNQCQDCCHLASCLDLWDRASNQSIVKSLTYEQVKAYIEEFNQFWQTETPSVQLPGLRN